MPSRAKKLERDVAMLPSVPKELVEHFLTGPMSGEAINAAGLAFKQALIEASLNTELSHHLGYLAGAEKPEGATNHRHGGTSKTVLTGEGKLRMAMPRDRNGSFEPVSLPKHARRFTAWVALYNLRRPHQALGYRTPMAAWRSGATRDPGTTAVDMTLRLDNPAALPTCPQLAPQQLQAA